MAQTLKPQLRKRIIESGRQEFVRCGFNDASMRRIAQNSGISVGNLYNYFPSKSELYELITRQSMDSLDELLVSVNSLHLTFKSLDYDLMLLKGQFKSIMGVFAERLCSLYVEKRDSLLVLMYNEEICQKIYQWFTGLLTHIIRRPQKDYSRLMSESVAISVFEGIRRIFEDFRQKDLNDSDNLLLFQSLVSDYMDFFGSVLDGYALED